MDKIWYINIEGRVEGPLSRFDLEEDDRLTPDTYVWKEGFKDWKKAREVPELQDLFIDESKTDEAEGSEKDKQKSDDISGEDMVLTIGSEPPFIFWVFIAILVLTYLVIQFWA